MTRVRVSKARDEFPELVNRAAYAGERIVLSRRGKDVAAVVPIKDLRLLERLSRQEQDRQNAEDALTALTEAEAEQKGTTPLQALVPELRH